MPLPQTPGFRVRFRTSSFDRIREPRDEFRNTLLPLTFHSHRKRVTTNHKTPTVFPNFVFRAMSTTNYSSALSPVGIDIVLRSSYADASICKHDREMGASPRLYQEHRSPDQVVLVLRPTEDMTWGYWASMVDGLSEFMVKWDNVGLAFEARFVGPPWLGYAFGSGLLYLFGGIGIRLSPMLGSAWRSSSLFSLILAIILLRCLVYAVRSLDVRCVSGYASGTFYILSLDCHQQFFLYLWIIVEEILHLRQYSSISSILSNSLDK